MLPLATVDLTVLVFVTMLQTNLTAPNDAWTARTEVWQQSFTGYISFTSQFGLKVYLSTVLLWVLNFISTVLSTGSNLLVVLCLPGHKANKESTLNGWERKSQMSWDVFWSSRLQIIQAADEEYSRPPPTWLPPKKTKALGIHLIK